MNPFSEMERLFNRNDSSPSNNIDNKDLDLGDALSAPAGGPSPLSYAPEFSGHGALENFALISGHGAPGVSAAASAATAPAPATVSVAGSNLSFDLVWDSSVASAPAGFMTAVEDAAEFYAANFTTPAATTVTIDVGYGEIMGGAIPGGAVSVSSDNGDYLSYSTLYKALKAEPKSADAILRHYFGAELPTPAEFKAATGKGAGKTDFFVTYSEEQALGLTPAYTYGEPDGWIGLSSAVSWNFSDTTLKSTGANGGGYDAVAAAASEIGEVLGRLNGLGQTLGLGKGPIYTLLDLSRYDVSDNARDFSASAAGYFSVTGGVAAEGLPADLGKYQTSSLFTLADIGDWKTTASVHDAFGYFTSGYNQPVSATDVLETATLGYQLTPAGVLSAKSPAYV